MKRKIIYSLLLLFLVLFVLGFVITPWFCILSFIPLVSAVIFLIYHRYIKK